MDTATVIGIVCGIALGLFVLFVAPIAVPYIERLREWVLSNGRGE